MKSRTRITSPRPGRVIVERDGVTTTYFAPLNGGYVRIYDPALGHPQVCERLSSTGSTLSVRSAAELPALIRRELRRRLRSKD